MNGDGAFDRLGDIAGGLVGDVAELPIVRLFGLAISAYAVLLWLAAAWWTMQDARRRHVGLPYLAAALVVLASPLLFPLALVVYHIVRPSATLAERRRLALEERLDELEIEGGALERCPHCGTHVEEDWLLCPGCRGRLGYGCADCGRAMGTDWTLCAWCGAEFGRERQRRAGRTLRPARRPATPAVLPAVRRA